jgi:hypothetical protein
VFGAITVEAAAVWVSKRKHYYIVFILIFVILKVINNLDHHIYSFDIVSRILFFFFFSPPICFKEGTSKAYKIVEEELFLISDSYLCNLQILADSRILFVIEIGGDGSIHVEVLVHDVSCKRV